MPIVYREATDCDGWHNGGAVAFSNNNSAYHYLALRLGEELMSGNPLLHCDVSSWSVQTEEGYRSMRVDYDGEEDDSGFWVTDHLSEAHDFDVPCECVVAPGTSFKCSGHRVSWNGRTPVDLSAAASV